MLKEKLLQIHLPEELSSCTEDRTSSRIFRLVDKHKKQRNANQMSITCSAQFDSESKFFEKLVSWRATENDRIEKQIQVNLNHMVYPIIETLRLHISPSKKSLIYLLESCLRDILSPMILVLENKFNTLSPCEVEICSMISKGFSSKQIALLRNISALTINDHRKNIRKKLGLTNTKKNLVTYLKSIG